VLRRGEREQWILGAVDHECGCLDLRQPRTQRIASVGQKRVIRHRRFDVDGPVDHDRCDRTRLVRVEPERAGVGPLLVDEVLDDGVAVRPLGRRRRIREPAGQPGRDRRQAGTTRACRHQGE
jgi:hypothetical protein